MTSTPPRGRCSSFRLVRACRGWSTSPTSRRTFRPTDYSPSPRKVVRAKEYFINSQAEPLDGSLDRGCDNNDYIFIDAVWVSHLASYSSLGLPPLLSYILARLGAIVLLSAFFSSLSSINGRTPSSLTFSRYSLPYL